jgi:hypothetical protein
MKWVEKVTKRLVFIGVMALHEVAGDVIPATYFHKRQQNKTDENR